MEGQAALAKALSPPQLIVEDDICEALRIKYKGASASCTIEVSAAGDILSKIGTAGAEAADANFTRPASGGTDGTIDVSDASAANLGLIVDFINSLDDYEAQIVSGLRADAAESAGTGSILARAASATLVQSPEGCPIYWDTSAALHQDIRVTFEKLTTRRARVDSENDSEMLERGVGRSSKRFRVSYVEALSTYGSGTSLLQIYKGVNKIYESAGGATTVVKTVGFADKENILWEAHDGESLLVRLLNSAAMSTTRLAVMAYVY